MKILEVLNFLEEIAPIRYQESYDNAGLIVGSADQEITNVLVSLDATPEVIDEAIALGCNLIVSHHPIVFRGLKRFNGKNYVEQSIIKAIRHDIALYAIHTNLDNVHRNGVNERICKQLELSNLQILTPNADHSRDEIMVGSGMIGTLSSPSSTMEFLKGVKDKMNAGCLKYTHIVKPEVQKIAVCGGSGVFLLPAAIQQGADVFITADIKYHEFFDTNGNITLVDIGHFESEQYTIDLLQELLSKNFSNFAAHYTKVRTNPVNYL